MDRRDLAVTFTLGGVWGAIAVTYWILQTVPAWMGLGVTIAAVITTVSYLKMRADLPAAPALRIRVPILTPAREAVNPVPPWNRGKPSPARAVRIPRMTWKEARAWRKVEAAKKVIAQTIPPRGAVS